MTKPSTPSEPFEAFHKARKHVAALPQQLEATGDAAGALGREVRKLMRTLSRAVEAATSSSPQSADDVTAGGTTEVSEIHRHAARARLTRLGYVAKSEGDK
jgi:hypothetical protein